LSSLQLALQNFTPLDRLFTEVVAPAVFLFDSKKFAKLSVVGSAEAV
jgi:hypothetical protein